MYRITKKTPTKIISQELWSSQLKALIRRDMINATCDEYTGAIVEQVKLNDVESIVHQNVEINAGEIESCYDYEGVEFCLNKDYTIMFDMSNGGDALKGECFWTVCNVCFTDDETDTEYTDIKIGRDAELLLEALINETMQSHIDEVAKEEYLTR